MLKNILPLIILTVSASQAMEPSFQFDDNSDFKEIETKLDREWAKLEQDFNESEASFDRELEEAQRKFEKKRAEILKANEELERQIILENTPGTKEFEAAIILELERKRAAEEIEANYMKKNQKDYGMYR